ncbi:hypothetical protein [Okeania sp. KiyG1]|uniref:hypothetical protein n=1 Tax=Okeania sp. KiyG1 TaxID=2720165 RepID=UPI0019212027|nr:hypothetical protein [Okeania sp. KiyG1]GGA04236.1 hypothetical protein CYANOKiyG1_16550 [Okeania sp. KiyG1]
MKSPTTRQTATIKEISGTLEIFIPDQNAKSTVKVKNFLDKTGVAISNSVLKSSDIEVLIQKPEDMNQDEQCEVKRQVTQQQENFMLARSLTVFFAEFKCSIFSSMLASIPQDKSIIILIKDVDSKLKGIEFESESGEVILQQASSSMGTFTMENGGAEIRVYRFEEKLPPKTRLNLYLFTAESVVTVPFKVVDVPLP